jgi:hypothetical protein
MGHEMRNMKFEESLYILDTEKSQKNAGQNRNRNTANKSYQIVAKFKYLVTPKNSMHEEITMTLNLETSFYSSVQNLVSFRSCLQID